MLIYYVDTCIWLNLFNKEERHWRIARDFIDKADSSRDTIIISTIVLKELYFKLKSDFQSVKTYLNSLDCVRIIKTLPQDYEFARNLEKNDKQKLSFYDYLHIAIAKRLNAILITRDRALIEKAMKYVKVSLPESLN